MADTVSENESFDEDSIYSENIIEEDGEELNNYHLSIHDDNFNNFNNIYDKTQSKHLGNKSKLFITKYEKTKIIGMRAQQLAGGCPALVTVPKSLSNVIDIALLEYKQQKLPFILERKMPNNSSEYYKISDLADIR